MVRRYARGYTEMTFSRLAVVTGAREAIIHKEFHLSSADPNLVGEDKARKIGRTTYDVADQLANLGMEALPPGAGRALPQTPSPLPVRNSFAPGHDCPLVTGASSPATQRVSIAPGTRQVQAPTFSETK